MRYTSATRCMRHDMTGNIRRAQPVQAGRLTALAHAAKRHWKYPERWIRLWRDDLTVSPRFIRSHPVFCAFQGDDLVGFYALSRRGAEFELEHLWVHPHHIGRGIGAKLFRHAVARIRARGGIAVRVASDPNAQGFYRRMGARRVGRVPSTPSGRHLPVLLLRVGRRPAILPKRSKVP
jgi:ribosomal protein S18 acetylase RimI-like enzyme